MEHKSSSVMSTEKVSAISQPTVRYVILSVLNTELHVYIYLTFVNCKFLQLYHMIKIIKLKSIQFIVGLKSILKIAPQ